MPNIPATRRLLPLLILAMAISTFCYVLISLHLPAALFANYNYDDALYLKHAESIVAGHWLGQYDLMTLVKGPGYPLFLAFNAVIGFPITSTQALLYSFSCALLAITLFRIFGAVWVCLLSFLVMQWHPAMFPIRIIRDDVTASQVLLILACMCQFVFLPTRFRNRLPWAIAGGTVLAWFWMTREDGIWLLPGLAIICFLQGLRLVPLWRDVRRLAISAAAFGMAAIGTLAVVAAINLIVYGSFAIVDIKNSTFATALSDLQSVRVGDPIPYIPVPAKVRRRIDIVSPAFASLEPFFNNDKNHREASCTVYPSTCGDIASGWFLWAFREAVAARGNYRTPAAADIFYRRLSAEVNTACENGKLECRRNLPPLMPAMPADQWDRTPAELDQMYRLATWQPGAQSWSIHDRTRPESTGETGQVNAMRIFLGNPLSTPMVSQPPTVAGWFRAPGKIWLRLQCTGAQADVTLPVIRQPSPDLVAHFHRPDAGDERFYVTLPAIQGCGFQTVPASPGDDYFNLGTADIGSSRFAGGTLTMDILSNGRAGPLHYPGQRALSLVGVISYLYGCLMPGATICALLVYAVSLIWALLRDRRRRFDAQLIILTGIGGLLLAHAGILVLVDISSFPAISPLYWGSGYPLLSLAVVLSLARVFLKKTS